MRITYLLSITAFILFSCQSKMEDPLMGLEIGENDKSWKDKIEYLKAEELLTEQEDDFQLYKMYFTKSDDSIYADIHINPDQYYFGRLRSVHFNLSADTVYQLDNKGIGLRASKPRPKEDIDKLYNWFVEKYGPPVDTLSLRDTFDGNLNEFINQSLNPNPVQSNMKLNGTKPKPGSFLWVTDTYKIYFFKGTAYDDLDFFDQMNSDSTRVFNPSVIYSISNYETELKSIIDSITDSNTLNDILKIDFHGPRWETYSNGNRVMKIPLSHLYINSPEEVRSVKAIKLDIILKNIFQDTLVFIEDTEFYLKEPINFNGGLRYVPNYKFEMEYNRWNAQFEELEAASKMKHDQVTAVGIIKALVFTDGTILKE